MDIRTSHVLMPVRGVVFDCGGVLTENSSPVLAFREAGQHGIPSSVLDGGFVKYRKMYDRGDISLCAMYDSIWHDAGIQLPKDARSVIADLDTASWLVRNERTISWMSRLRARGYVIGILTNMPPSFARLFRACYHDAVEMADAIVVSGEDRICKPDGGAYALLERRIGLSPSELLFIDDIDDNCAMAESRGWRSIRFTGNAATEAEFDRIITEQEKQK